LGPAAAKINDVQGGVLLGVHGPAGVAGFTRAGAGGR
jgi:hypothetical protein